MKIGSPSSPIASLSPALSSWIALLFRLATRACARARVEAFCMASRAASVAAAPLPIIRSLRTTRAPASRAISDVASVEPSSATQTVAPGKAAASASSVTPIRGASL